MAKVAIKNYMEKTDYFGWILHNSTKKFLIKLNNSIEQLCLSSVFKKREPFGIFLLNGSHP